MNNDTSAARRAASYAAAAFTVCFVVAGVLLGEVAGALGDPDGVFIDHYASGANRTGDIAGAAALVIGGAAFLVFVAAARLSLGNAGGVAASVFSQAGGACGVLLLVSAGLLMATPLTISFGREFDDTGQLDGGLVAVLPPAGMVMLLVPAMLAASVSIGSLALAARGAGTLPTWHVRLSFVCAALLVVAFFYMPVIALPVWSAATAAAFRRAPTNSAS